MRDLVILIVFCVLGSTVTGQYSATVFPYYQKSQQVFTLQETTMKPQTTTELPLTPKTSISVHHTVVRNKPAYPYPYTESSLQAAGSEDTSYYYTYEDSSEEKGQKSSTTPQPTKPTSTSKSTVRSFWNSQKAQLDARRKEGSQKFLTTYSKPTVRSDPKPKIEFKVREKPKFGLSSKNKITTTTTDASKVVESITQKPVKNFKNEANVIDQSVSEKEEITKNSTKSGDLLNQIVGRIGEIPLQNMYQSQIQSPIRSQPIPTKFDASTGNIQYIDNTVKYQPPPVRNNYNPSIINPQSSIPVNTPEEFLINLSKQQQPILPSNQQSALGAIQQLQHIQTLLNNNQQALLNANQQQPLLRANPNPPQIQKPLINTNQQLQLNSNQQPPPILNQQLNTNQQQPLNTNFNPLSLLSNIHNQQQQSSSNDRSPIRAFISTSPGENMVGRSSEQYLNTNNPSSSLLQRLGTLGLNLAGRDSGGGGVILGRDGGLGNGLTFNLGPVADPLSILLKLLSLIPRPLLDLNGKVFFGIELGKNAGLVSGAKPIGKPIG